MEHSLRKKVQAWRERIGYKDALEALMAAKISKSAAQKILADQYDREPKPLLLQALEMAMKDQ